METFIEINGLKIPILTEDNKVFKDTKAFKNDRKNSIDSGKASKMFSKSSTNQNEISTYQKSVNDGESYLRATKDFLIVSENGNVYEDIVKNENDKNGCLSKRIVYNFKDGHLHTTSCGFTMLLNLKEPFETKEGKTTEIHSGLTQYYEYFPNGQLKSYRIYFGGLGIKDENIVFSTVEPSSFIGTWYKFDESGEILQTIDFEKDYKTSFLDIFIIARKKLNELYLKGGFEFHRGYPGFQRNKNENGAFWQLFIANNYYMIIDDATGKVIEEVESADFDKVQKKFSKYMKPTIEYNKAINEFFENNLLPTSND